MPQLFSHAFILIEKDPINVVPGRKPRIQHLLFENRVLPVSLRSVDLGPVGADQRWEIGQRYSQAGFVAACW